MMQDKDQRGKGRGACLSAGETSEREHHIHTTGQENGDRLSRSFEQNEQKEKELLEIKLKYN